MKCMFKTNNILIMSGATGSDVTNTIKFILREKYLT